MRNNFKIGFVIVLFLLANTYVLAQNYITYSPDNPKIQYEGRIDFSDSTRPLFAYPGVSIKAAFEGQTVKFTLKSYIGIDNRSNYFNVFIDDIMIEKIELKDDTLIEFIYPNIDVGTHVIEITKRTESSLGKVEFHGFKIAGVLKSLYPKPNKKIEFIGNSITCGYGNEDISTNGFNPSLENNYLAYGAICARELNVRYQAIAYSGRGVVFNYNCFVGELVPDFYEKYIADEDTIGSNKYNHKSYNPDIIVINLGTNDHNCNKLNDENFKIAYLDFISRLKIYHPRANILCLTGPMNVSSIFKTRIEDIVKKSGGEENGVFYFHQTGTIDSSYKGGHSHPNTKMAEINGKEVAAFIEANNLFNITKIKNDNLKSFKKKVYPNPLRNEILNIDLTAYNLNDDFQINILNLQGEIVFSKPLKAGLLNKLEVKILNGLFILAIKNKHDIYYSKLVVHK